MQIDVETGKQFLRYAAVGLVSNSLLFVAYILLTGQGIGYKTAMSVLYIIGVLITFTFNKKWTFSHRGHLSKTFIAYSSIYALGYILNWVTLYTFVDIFGFRHQWVQGFMIVILAVLLFTLQKFEVFRKT